MIGDRFEGHGPRRDGVADRFTLRLRRTMRNRARTTWACALIVGLAALPSGCDAGPRPSDTELYGLVLDRLRDELDLGPHLAIHPRLALWDERAGLYAPLTDFNAFDTTAVPLLVDSDANYSQCTPSVAGTCREEPGRTAVILSELRELGPQTVAVRLMVSDAAKPAHFQRHYFARVAAALTGWSVVEFREVPGTRN